MFVALQPVFVAQLLKGVVTNAHSGVAVSPSRAKLGSSTLKALALGSHNGQLGGLSHGDLCDLALVRASVRSPHLDSRFFIR